MHIIKDRSGRAIKVFTPHFDTHVHGRRRPMMDTILPIAAQRMCGGMFEPNTAPHIENYGQVLAYLSWADAAAPKCKWVGSIYHTPHTSPSDVILAWEQGLISHVKRYPVHGTTNSDEAVTLEMILDKNSKTAKLLDAMSEAGVPLKNHGEVVEWQGKKIPPDKRESIYYNEVQPRICDLYPNLRQIGAHISSMAAVEHYREFGDPDDYIAEVTPHHPMFDDNIRFDGGALLPNHHCLPVIKNEEHREALRELIAEKPAYLVAGSDMAAHDSRKKYAEKVAGGIWSYHCSIELYIQLLDEIGALDYAEDFLYGNAKRFHKKLVPDNPQEIELVRLPWKAEDLVSYYENEDTLVTMTPFGYDSDPAKRFEFQWQIV
jgi:dihydroorotase